MILGEKQVINLFKFFPYWKRNLAVVPNRSLSLLIVILQASWCHVGLESMRKKCLYFYFAAHLGNTCSKLICKSDIDIAL